MAHFFVEIGKEKETIIADSFVEYGGWLIFRADDGDEVRRVKSALVTSVKTQK